MNESKIDNKKNLNTVYVFSENNKVYIKNNSCSKISNNSSAINEEWYPINFQWRALMELKKNMQLHTSDENQ